MAAQELPKEFPCGSGSRRFPKNSPLDELGPAQELSQGWLFPSIPEEFPRFGSLQDPEEPPDPFPHSQGWNFPLDPAFPRWEFGIGKLRLLRKTSRDPWKNGIWRGSFGSSSFSMGIHGIPTPGRAKSWESSPIPELGSFTSKDSGPHSQKTALKIREYPGNPMPSRTNPAQILLCHSRFSFSLWNFSVGTAGNHQHSRIPAGKTLIQENPGGIYPPNPKGLERPRFRKKPGSGFPRGIPAGKSSPGNSGKRIPAAFWELEIPISAPMRNPGLGMRQGKIPRISRSARRIPSGNSRRPGGF